MVIRHTYRLEFSHASNAARSQRAKYLSHYSLYIFAVVLPLNVLLVLLTYARKKELHATVRLYLEWIAAISTIIALALALFFHASWVHGLVFFVASLVAGLLALYFVHTPETESNEQGVDG